MGLDKGRPAATATVTAQNTGTGGLDRVGGIEVSIGGSGWSATISLQRSFDAGATWLDVKDYTAPAEEQITNNSLSGVLHRLWCKTGNFGSGSIPLRLQ